MAVNTVNAQRYDAVMAVKGMAAPSAAKIADSVSQNFGEILNKAGNEIVDGAKADTNGAQASKSQKKQDVRISKSESPQASDDKLEKANTPNDAEADKTVTDKKTVEDTKVEKREAVDTKAEQTSDGLETDEVDKEPVDKLSEKQITDALMQIIEQIKELLGISDEEILLGMEKAGLNMADMLELAGISKLLTVTAGEGDVMSLVTNAELYAALKELTKTVETVSNRLLDELGITKEELDAMLVKLGSQENADDLKNADTQVSLNPQEQTKDVSAMAADTDKANVKQTAQTDVQTLIKSDANAEQTDTTKSDVGQAIETMTKPVNESDAASTEEEAEAPAEAATGEDTDISTQEKNPEKTLAVENTADISADSAAKNKTGATVQNQQSDNAANAQTKPMAHKNAQEHGDLNGQKHSPNNFSGQQNAQIFDNSLNTAQAAAEALARYTSENTQSILRQLADVVRVIRNENLTQMEMQLHPASLGTVNVSLVTKGGTVTAEFTTQNEAVKAAIEAQAAQLVKNLEAQGVKVEAVEVSVAGHGLERNLDENNRNDQSRQEQEEAQRIQGSRRNINLNMYEDDEEMLNEIQGADDATRIAMEIMAANGNSMDLMA